MCGDNKGHHTGTWLLDIPADNSDCVFVAGSFKAIVIGTDMETVGESEGCLTDVRGDRLLGRSTRGVCGVFWVPSAFVCACLL